MENNNKSCGNLWVVVFTSLITFIICAIIFVGINKLNPDFAIKFGRNAVKYENIKKFDDVREIIKTKFYKDVPDDSLLEGAINGMAESLMDPYTVYYTKENLQMFKERSQGSYCGVGFSVKPENGILTVIETFDGSPARNSGILSGDKIVKVDDKDVTTINDEEIIIAMIKGIEGTQVKLNIYRKSEDKYKDFIVTRKVIKVENIKSEILKGDIGYIKLSLFDSDIAEYFNNHLGRLLTSGIKGLIIDVRDNPGGNYVEVVKICDRLLPKGLIVYTQDKAGAKKEEISDPYSLEIPIVVLVNENSASASEILAGALKDNKKGELVGVKTYGKGLVQTIQPFDDGSGLKYTIAKYFTPTGGCIDKLGIEPDFRVPFEDKYKDAPISQIPRKDDIQLNKAMELLKAK